MADASAPSRTPVLGKVLFDDLRFNPDEITEKPERR